MHSAHTLLIAFYVIFYFNISIGLGFFSSYYLNSKNYNFRFPLFITSMQNLIHFILSSVVIYCIKTPSKKNKQSILSYSMTTLPCAISAALDIGIGSYALRSVSLAYYTMIKSSSPVFVLLCGFLFGVERPSIKLFLVVFVIGMGVFLTTVKTETSHIKICLSNTTFILLFASFMSGFRWAFIQYIMKKKGCTSNMPEKEISKLDNNKVDKKSKVNLNDKALADIISSENKELQTSKLKNSINIDFYKMSEQKVITKINKEEMSDQQRKITTDTTHTQDKNFCCERKHNDDHNIDTIIKNDDIEKTDSNYVAVIETVRSLCIPIGCFLFLFSCTFEGMYTIVTSEFFKNAHSIKMNAGYILLTGVLTFTLLVSEFLLVSKTSVIFLSVCGIVKELMIVFISVCRKDITFEMTNYVGLGVSIFGMILYNFTRMKK